MPVFIIRRENRAALTWATYLKLWALLILSSANDKNKRRYWHCTAGAESDVVNIQGLAHLRGFRDVNLREIFFFQFMAAVFIIFSSH